MGKTYGRRGLFWRVISVFVLGLAVQAVSGLGETAVLIVIATVGSLLWIAFFHPTICDFYLVEKGRGCWQPVRGLLIGCIYHYRDKADTLWLKVGLPNPLSFLRVRWVGPGYRPTPAEKLPPLQRPGLEIPTFIATAVGSLASVVGSAASVIALPD